MSALVLIHGGMHGPWCWDQILPLLRDAGHEVHPVALDADHSPFLSAVDDLVDRLLLEATV